MGKQLQHLGLTLLAWLIRAGFSLRYRLKVSGLDQLRKEQKKGILFFPNHPAEIDPIILMFILWKDFRPHPLVLESFYYQKGIHFFMRIVGSLPLPTIDVIANSWKAKRVEKMVQKIKQGIEKGGNFLVYPSGRLKIAAAEALGASSFVHSLLKEAPQAKVILIRTTGLWGSSFSRAITGKSPDFGKTLWAGIKILLKNWIFFAPRREVKIEFASAPADFPRSAERQELNRYLENWYNRYPEPGPEPLSLVSFSFWRKDLPQITNGEEERKRRAQKAEIPPEVEKEVFNQLATLSRRPVEKIKREMHLANDLGLDSLDLTQLYLFLDERYGLGDLAPGEVQTVEDLLQIGAGSRKEKEQEEERKKIVWPEESSRPPPGAPKGETLAEAFLLICDQMGDRIACGDALSGLLSYRKVKRAALVLSLKIKEMKGEKIGIMLPSTSAVYLLILATLLAKKIPVMLNWTAGLRALEHAVKLSGIETVISSMRFLGQREMGDLGSVDEKILFLEDIRFSIGLKEKLSGLFLSYQKASALLKKLQLDTISKDACAAILFTSGTEALPKGVPLTHDNLLSNQRAAFERVQLKPEDRLIGVLPPFHSFGFSVSGLLPLFSGLQVAFSPDPTDSHGLVVDIEHWKPTLIFLAPTFFKTLFRSAKPEQLGSIRLFVTGAEKAPEELFDYVHKLGSDHLLLEGYGITECGPIVSLNHPEKPPKGVGEALAGVSLCVIDSETHELLPAKKEGEICVFGPNVFHGYLGDRPSPFIKIDGKNWYRSGDRGYLDEEGNLFLSGRLKRFIKIGGEMVSLGGLEEELLKLAHSRQWIKESKDVPQLAVAVREKDSEKPLIVLIATFPVSTEDVNQALKDSGYGRLVKIAEVKQVKEIPLTGTGKTHYRLLDEIVSQDEKPK